MGFLSSLFSAAPQTTGANTSNTAGLNLGNYGPQIAAALQQYNQGQAGTQGLAQQLQGFLTNGTGPNLAQQQLANATQANNAAAAGAIASQQGLNPGLAARQIQNTTAANNMTAAGQSAEARLQQQIADQAQIGQLYGQETNAANQNQQQALGAQGQQNATTSANTNAGQQMTAGQYQANLADSVGLINGIGSAVGTGTGLAAIPKAAGALGNSFSAPTGSVSAPAGGFGIGNLQSPAGMSDGGVVKNYMMSNPETRRKAIMVKLSPGEKRVDPDTGAMSTVQGKAKVDGNSPKNDTVLEKDKEGTVIIPRTVAESPKLSAEFLAAVKAHQKDRISAILKASRAK